MKVLHLVAGDLDGGAAKGAYWLHLALMEKGVDSIILTNSIKKNLGQNVMSIASSKVSKLKILLREEIDNNLSCLYREQELRIFSPGMIGYDFTKTKEYHDADVIHLHWINGGFVNIKHLAKIKKPLVWTIRDMWPMTGGCHAYECDNYITGCGFCKQLHSKKRIDLSRLVVRRKKKYIPEHTTLVGISNWVRETTAHSYLFSGFDTRTIYNGIDTRIFKPISKSIARDILNIGSDKKVILCGACSLKDLHKGFDKFLEAINHLDKSKYLLCFFGHMDDNLLSDKEFEYLNFGFLHDIVSMQLLYSSADVFVAPSIIDAFGKTLVESMACGTPVVCFDATGPRDIVDHLVNGYKAEPFDSVDLAAGIDWAANNNEYSKLCLNAREKAESVFDIKFAAQKYLELYHELIDKL